MSSEFEQPQIPKPEDIHSESEKGSSNLEDTGLYGIVEKEDGRVVVNLPGAFHEESGDIVGLYRKEFKSREEAEDAIIEAKKNIELMRDQASLKKTYGTNMYRIDKSPDDTFRVTVPGLKDMGTGKMVGYMCKNFKTWEEARDFLQQSRQEFEKLSENPLLEIELGDDARVSYSDFNAFRPVVTPTKETFDIPPEIEKYIIQQEKLVGEEESSMTYQETIKESGWENQLYSFVKDYLDREGAKITQDIGIKRLDSLTPRQAVELASRIVVELTKYDYDQVRQKKETIADRLAASRSKSRADQSTALQLLQEGLRRKDDPDWEGNGVCRNFASIEKAVFEAIKASQTEYSMLRNTYALYERGEQKDYAPQREDYSKYSIDRGGHAWNTFVTVNKEGAANATIVDTTWAKTNLETGKVEGLDYTLARMEPTVYSIGKGILSSEASTPEQLNQLLSYYILRYDRSEGTKGITSAEQDKSFLAKRALDLIDRNKKLPSIPKEMMNILSAEYTHSADLVDPNEIEKLWNIAQVHPEFPINKVVDSYLKKPDLFSAYGRDLTMHNVELQRYIIERVKHDPKFDELVRKQPGFRAHVRDAYPEILPEFDPNTRKQDARELKHLIDGSNLLRNYSHYVDPSNPNPERIGTVFQQARKMLSDLNPDRYNEVVSKLDNYQMIKRFDSLYRELQKK